jgi:hypothetical protein
MVASVNIHSQAETGDKVEPPRPHFVTMRAIEADRRTAARNSAPILVALICC